MLRLTDPGIDQDTSATLAGYQATVTAAGGYAAQVEAAREEFRRRNRASNPTFKIVRTQLERMCTSPGRCGWCEDSEAREIDHIKPKALYPEEVFAWPNFLRACGTCNKTKGDRFALMIGRDTVDITRGANQPVVRPPGGPAALIDPRTEDPIEFVELDIFEGTFRLQPRFGMLPSETQRADYTIELLDLNRALLTTARSVAYDNHRLRLSEYRALRDGGASESELGLHVKALVSCPHPTVWREMQRQHPWITALDQLFRDVPEALSWT